VPAQGGPLGQRMLNLRSKLEASEKKMGWEEILYIKEVFHLTRGEKTSSSRSSLEIFKKKLETFLRKGTSLAWIRGVLQRGEELVPGEWGATSPKEPDKLFGKRRISFARNPSLFPCRRGRNGIFQGRGGLSPLSERGGHSHS